MTSTQQKTHQAHSHAYTHWLRQSNRTLADELTSKLGAGASAQAQAARIVGAIQRQGDSIDIASLKRGVGLAGVAQSLPLLNAGAASAGAASLQGLRELSISHAARSGVVRSASAGALPSTALLVDFVKLDMSGKVLDLSGRDLRGADLNAARLVGADLGSANLEQAHLMRNKTRAAPSWSAPSSAGGRQGWWQRVGADRVVLAPTPTLPQGGE